MDALQRARTTFACSESTSIACSMKYAAFTRLDCLDRLQVHLQISRGMHHESLVRILSYRQPSLNFASSFAQIAYSVVDLCSGSRIRLRGDLYSHVDRLVG